MKAILDCALLAFVVAGCATPRESWVAGDAVLGEAAMPKVRVLKRLVLLPPTYDIDGNIERPWVKETEDQRLQAETIRYLGEWKDYRVKPALAPAVQGALAPSELRVRLLDHLAVAFPGARLPEALATGIRQIAAAQEADGVVVLGVRYVGLNAQRWGAIYGITFLTMGIGQYGYLATLGTYFTAAVVDGSSGEVVWWARNQSGSWGEPAAASDIGRFAFDALPTALPDALIEDSGSTVR